MVTCPSLVQGAVTGAVRGSVPIPAARGPGRAAQRDVHLLGSQSGITSSVLFSSFLKKLYLFIFRERGREGEREGEKHQCVVDSCTPYAGDLACNPGLCPDWESNQQPLASQVGTQSTDPQKTGLLVLLKNHTKPLKTKRSDTNCIFDKTRYGS